MRTTHPSRLAILLAATASISTTARAVDRYWIAATNASWTSSATTNWSATNGGASGASVPSVNDNAYFFTTTDKTANLALNYNSPGLNILQLDGSASATMTLNQSAAGFNMYAATENIGLNGKAAYTQFNNSNNFSSQLLIGGAGTTGTYTLSGGTLNGVGTAFASVGRAGTGTFIQTGGLHTGSANYSLDIADFPGSSGYYSLSGTGTVNIPYITVGSGGSGTFLQSGGTVGTPFVGNNSLTVGTNSTGPASSYTLTAGSINLATLSIASAAAGGTFTQSAGNVTGTLDHQLIVFIGNNAGATGTYNFSGTAQLATQQLTVGADGGGLFKQTGGTLTATSAFLGAFGSASNGSWTIDNSAGTAVANLQSLSVGDAGIGTFGQNAGSVTTTTDLFVGHAAGSNGTLVVSAGTFAAATTGTTFTATVGSSGTGLMANTGGTLTIGAPSVPSPLIVGHNPGSVGSFYQYGGTSTVYGPITLADAGGTGTLYVAAGTLSTPATVNVGLTSGASATLNLQGGTLSSPFYTVFGLLDFAAGTLAGPSGTANTHVTNYGTVRGSLVAPNVGAFNAVLDNYGTVTATAGGTLTVNGGINNFATIALPLGATVAAAGPGLLNEGAVSLTGGTLATSSAFIINDGLISGTGTIGGTGGFQNNALLTVAAGNITLANAGPNANAGTITLAPGWQLRLQSSLTNNGTLDLAAGSVVGTTGSLTNASPGIITGKGAILGSFLNQGSLLLTGGTLNTAQPFNSTGTIQLSSNTAALTGGQIFNSGTLMGFGTVGNTLNNTGTTRASNGTLTLANTVTTSPTSLLAANPNATLLLLKPLTNSGTISLAGGSVDTNNQPLTNNNAITGFGTLSTGGTGLTNNASITLTGGATTITGPLTNNSSLRVLYNPALFTSPVSNAGTIAVVNTTATFAAGLTGNPPSAPSSFILQPSSLSSVLLSGSLTVDPTSSALSNYIRQDAVTSTGSITIRPLIQGGDTSSLNTLTLTGPAASFDLADTKLIVSITPTPTIRQYLLTHALFSSTANNDPQHRLAIGYARASQLGLSTWGLQPADPTSLLTKLTYLGDANLDGRVDPDDYALLDRGFRTAGTTWTQGDFNYDGAVTSADYLLIDRVVTQQTGILSPTLLTQRESQFGPDYVSQLIASVPEPTSTLACLFAILPLTRRRQTLK